MRLGLKKVVLILAGYEALTFDFILFCSLSNIQVLMNIPRKNIFGKVFWRFKFFKTLSIPESINNDEKYEN